MQIIAIHGNGQSKEIFDQLDIENLKAINLPGHGDCVPLKNYSISLYADAVLELITDDCTLLGHSLGGHVALEVATRSDKVKRLISIGAPPVNNDCLANAFCPVEELGLIYQENLSEEQMKAFCSLENDNQEFVEDLVAMMKKQDPKARSLFAASLGGGVEDEHARIKGLQVPHLYLYGSNEKLINLDFIKSLSFLNVKFIEAGHNIMLDNPDDFTKAVKDFLKN